VAAMSRASVAAAGEAAAGDSGPAGADLVVKVPELLLVCVEAGDGDAALDEPLADLLEAGEGDEPVDGEGGEDGERGDGEEAQAHLVLGGVPVDAAAGTSLDARMAEPAAGLAHARRSDELDRTAEAPRMAVALGTTRFGLDLLLSLTPCPYGEQVGMDAGGVGTVYVRLLRSQLAVEESPRCRLNGAKHSL
jgi:hypothetical protein